MKIDRSKIKLVDGFKIRNTIDDDFSVLHDHSHLASRFSPKFYIPEGEWWLDSRFREELDFFTRGEELIETLISEQGLSYHEARVEIKKEMTLPGPVPDFRVRTEERDGITLAHVDGALVRKYLDPEFVFGGHEYVYDYVPAGEIWLDNRMDPLEIPYIYLHELVERNLMKEGKRYAVAHEFATAADMELRRADGAGSYPGDEGYPWYGKSNEELAKEYYVA